MQPRTAEHQPPDQERRRNSLQHESRCLTFRLRLLFLMVCSGDQVFKIFVSSLYDSLLFGPHPRLDIGFRLSVQEYPTFKVDPADWT